MIFCGILNEFNIVSLSFSKIGIFPKFITTIVLIFLSYWVNKIISNLIEKTNWASVKIIKYKNIISVILKLISLILITTIWFYASKDIFTFLGLSSAGIALASKDFLANFLGWFIINSHTTFKVGDRIKVGDSMGDVVQIDWVYTTIIEVTQINKVYGQSTGRLVQIPNSKILSNAVINETTTFPYVWNEISINLTLNSNWEKAKDIIMKIASDILGNIEKEAKHSLYAASKIHPIHYQNLSHTIYTSIDSARIVLTLRFLCGSRNFRNIEHDITEEILREFKKHDDINLS